MLKAIILLSFISLVVSENTTEPKYQGTHGACAYKRSASDNKVLDLFVKFEGGDWVLGQCDEDDDACRDWWNNEVLDFCKESEDHCKDYTEGNCKGGLWKFGDWYFWKWLVWIVIVIVSVCLCRSLCHGFGVG